MESSVPKSEQLKQVVNLRESDLPLSCPMPNMTLWNMHPKVYLEITKEQPAVCPYCGARYVLTDE
jgi:uncharacterized Zn-finger protein